MTTYRFDERTRSGVLAALGLGAVWAVAAAFRPTSTYHLAPILIAALVPFLGGPADDAPSSSLRAAFTGAAIAVLVATLLAIADLLRGPSLLPFGDAFAEALVFAGVGAIAGLLFSFFNRR